MRKKLLKAAQEMVQDRGLDSVSFQDLADAVGLKKPSVFHHFRTKDDLAKALLESCRTTYGSRYEEVLSQSDLSGPDKLREIARIFEVGLKANHLCLLGALSSSCGGFSQDLKRDLRDTAQLIIARYAKVFEEGRNAGTLNFQGSTHDAATAYLAMLQGLQVLARASSDVETFFAAAASYVDSITQ